MAYIEIDGMKEFQTAVRRAKDVELNRRLGEANKRIGEMVISRLSPAPDPRAVGVGAGASVRPSTTRREVLLRVGGSHRSSGPHTRKQPWGRKRVTPVGKPAPDRPYIQQTADRQYDEIGNAWLQATFEALGPAFADQRLGP